MKAKLVILLGLFMSVSALGGIFLIDGQERNTKIDIRAEMEKKFAIRDTFKEKGNSGKYLKVSHMQP